jgi:flagellar motility protein MotE (MotC chaperone)
MASDEKEVPAENEAPAAPAKSGKGNLLPIAAGGLVFVIFVVIFSLKFGVFDQTAPEPTETMAAAEQEEPTGKHVDQTRRDDFRGQYYGSESTRESATEESLSEEDSLAQVAWYIQQKQEIASERAALEEEKGKLQRLHDKTEILLRQRTGMEQANLASLAKLYESMKSDQLVPILANLPDERVSLIISKMKKQKASEVLGKIEPERAARITNWLLSLEGD